MEEEKYYQPKKLTPRHLALMRELLCGTKQKDISRIFGITQSRISIIVNSPRFKQEMENMKVELASKFTTKEANKDSVVDSARKILDKEVTNSLNTIIEIRDGTGVNDDVRLRASGTLLDRAGIVKIEKLKVESKMDVSENLLFALRLGQKSKEE